MKWIRICSALVATFGLATAAQAGFGHHKSCGCADTWQPECCAPVITRPCHVNVFTYQRQCSNIKPPCCDTGCAPACCAPKKSLCERLFGHGHHQKDECCPAAECCPAVCAGPAQACAPACPTPACCPAPTACAAPQGCCPTTACGCAPKKKGWFNFGGGRGLFSHHQKDDCCPTAAGCCGPQGCVDSRCCTADPCEIACLIYESQTACYAKDRRKAIDKLGKYSCVCNPEIMCAFIYALNDADEGVRKEAADEIGDQLRKNPCCCTADVVAALTYALADCDKGVRKQAEQALRACGYEIVDGCCDVCCATTGCAPTGCAPAATGAPATAPPAEPMDESAPAPAPPVDAADPGAYFPRRVQPSQATAPKTRGSRLADLFGLAR